MKLRFNTERRKYAFFWGLVLVSTLQGLYFSNEWSISKGLMNLITHHNLIDTGGFYHGGMAGVFINAALSLSVMLILFRLTNTKLTSSNYPALLLTYAYSFYGKNFLNILPLAIGVYLYAYTSGKKLCEYSNFACYAGALSPLVSTLAFHTPMINRYGLVFSIIFAIIVGLIAGYFIANISHWVPDILRGRSILVGAACVGLVAIVLTNGLQAFGISWPAYIDPPYIDQDYRTEIFICYFLVLLYFIIVGVFSEYTSYTHFIDSQLKGEVSTQLIEDYGFGQTVFTTGAYGLIMFTYMIINPTTDAHGELWAGLFTGAAFVAKGLTIRYAAPFLLGMIGFNFISAGVNGSLNGLNFFLSGIRQLGSRATMMGTYVGSNIAPLNEKIGFKRGVIMGIIYAIIVPNVSVLHNQTVLYNSGFAIALTVLLYNVAEHNHPEKFIKEN